ncbi:WD40 repeat domain-containing protein [Kitasatospora sp. NA04385]|uniref:WD40 repeat domain-containing protein n=1 Tax=Kitasatospora sp. NA04385 TaxID=2742135 RepID=UPI0020CAAABB|nr:WD40 repeat domain-containing protein [Kitasatospora sp. NA04385]
MVPEELRDLVARCLSKDRLLRPTLEEIAGTFGLLNPSVRPWPDAVHARIDEQQATIVRLLGLDGAEGQLVASDTGTVVLARRTANQDLSTITAPQVPAGPAPLLPTPGAADSPADEGVDEDSAARRRPSRRTLLFGALGAGAVAATAVPLALMRTSGSPEAGGSETLPPPTSSPSTSPPVTASPSTSSSPTATPTPSSTPEELAYRASFKWKTMLSALDYSPDGKLLAVGDFDSVLMLWNSTDLVVAATLGNSYLPGIENLTSAVRFSPDGTLLASVDNFATITLWDVASRQKAATIQGDKDQKSAGFSNLAFSPDGKTLAYSGNRVITLWDVQSRSLVATLVNPIENPTYKAEGDVASMAFAQDGRTIIASTDLDRDDLLRFWDVRRGTLTATIEHAGDGVIALAVSPDGKVLATVSRGEVKVWDVATRAMVETLPFTSDPVCALAFSPDGGSLAAAEQTGGVRIWSTATWNPIRGLDQAKSLDPTLSMMPDSLVFSPDSKVLVGNFGYRLARWKVG